MARVVLVLVLAAGCAAVKAVPPAAPAPLELVVLGSGGPRSFGRAGSSAAVLVGGQPRVLVDVGPGASLTFGRLGLDYEPLDTILLTHLHIDHAGDLPGLLKSLDLSFSGRTIGLHIVGPEGGGEYPATSRLVEGLFGEEGVFRYLRTFRNELALRVTDIPVGEKRRRTVVDSEGVTITALSVDHAEVPAVAYRIDAGGRSIVVTGDLASEGEGLIELAKGADVLLYDTAVLDPPAAPPQLYRLHTSPRRIGEVAAAAGVKRLVLGHLTPSVERSSAEVLASIRERYRGPVVLAEDGLRVPLP